MAADKAPRRKRIDCKIMQLPADIRQQVEDMIAGRYMKYQEVSDWLAGQGYQISKSAIGDYSTSMGKVAQQLADDLAKSKAILEFTKGDPDLDPAKAAQVLLSSNLMQKILTSEDEMQEMPLEKAGRLLASFRRVDVAERKLLFEQRSKIDLAFAEMESQIMQAIGQDAALAAQLRGILAKAKERVTDDES